MGRTATTDDAWSMRPGVVAGDYAAYCGRNASQVRLLEVPVAPPSHGGSGEPVQRCRVTPFASEISGQRTSGRRAASTCATGLTAPRVRPKLVKVGGTTSKRRRQRLLNALAKEHAAKIPSCRTSATNSHHPPSSTSSLGLNTRPLSIIVHAVKASPSRARVRRRCVSADAPCP